MFWINGRFDYTKLCNNYWKFGFRWMLWIHGRFDNTKLCKNYWIFGFL